MNNKAVYNTAIKLNNKLLPVLYRDNHKNIKLLIWILNNFRLNHKNIKLDYNDLKIIWGLSKSTRKYKIEYFLEDFIQTYSINRKLIYIEHNSKSHQIIFQENNEYSYLYKYTKKNFMLFNFKDLIQIGIDDFYTKIFITLASVGNFHTKIFDKKELLQIVNMSLSTKNKRLKDKLSQEKLKPFRNVFKQLNCYIKYDRDNQSNILFIFEWMYMERHIHIHYKHINISMTDNNLGLILQGLNSINSGYNEIMNNIQKYEHSNHVIIDNKDEILNILLNKK